MDRLRLVVGVDGSTAAREALRWASRFATVLGGEIVVVHALGLRDLADASARRSAERRRDEIEEVVESEWCSMLRGEGPPFRVEVGEGDAVDLLLATAVDAEPVSGDPGDPGGTRPLVVLGTCGLGAPGELDLGRTSLAMLQAGRLPVLLVPQRDRAAAHLSLRRILVGLDDQPAAEEALALASVLAARFGSWVSIVHAATDGKKPRVDALRSRIEGLGLPVHVSIERGAPHEVIRAAAARLDADLVVVGSDHAGAHVAPGAASVSRQVVRLVQRPTLVVPAPPLPVVRGGALLERHLNRA